MGGPAFFITSKKSIESDRLGVDGEKVGAVAIFPPLQFNHSL